MRRLFVALCAFLLLIGACSSTPSSEPTPAPAAAAAVPAFDPSGMYDFVATMGSESRTGTLEFERTANGFEGEAWLEGEGDPARIVAGGQTGNHVVLNALVGMNDVTFELDFTGATFAGTITAGDATIDVTGTKRAQ